MKILSTVLLSCVTTFAVADTTLTFINNNDKVAMQMQFANNMMRATSVDDNSAYMVYDANNTTFTMFATDKKQYFVMGKEQLDALGDIGAMMEKMLEEQLADIPESQRAMMRNMMAGAVKAQMPKPVAKAEYSFTGKSSSYNGFDCKIVIKQAGKKQSKFCVTHYSNIGMQASEYAVITSFQKTIEKLAQQYGADNSMDFSSLGGYIPVQYNQAGAVGVLSKVSHASLDPDIFAIPEGYSKMDMPF